MKKLGSLIIVLLFVVVGMAGIAGTAQAASIDSATAAATLKGKVIIANFSNYDVMNAKVRTNNSYFIGTKRTNANGKFAWMDMTIPACNGDVSGLVGASFDLAMFGATLRFQGTSPFVFINPVQFGTPTEIVRIEMSLKDLIF